MGGQGQGVRSSCRDDQPIRGIAVKASEHGSLYGDRGSERQEFDTRGGERMLQPLECAAVERDPAFGHGSRDLEATHRRDSYAVASLNAFNGSPAQLIGLA